MFKEHGVLPINGGYKKQMEGLFNVVTSCDVLYTDEEREFMTAMDRYKNSSKRQFPNCSEVLAVLKSLGYRKVTESGPLPTYSVIRHVGKAKGTNAPT